MNKYEVTYILRTGVEPERIQKLEGRIAKAFEKHGGTVLLQQDHGERALAYLIDKEGKGHYKELSFVGAGELVDEIEHQLRIASEVLRFLTVRLGRSVDVEQEKATAEEQARAARAAVQAAREAAAAAAAEMAE